MIPDSVTGNLARALKSSLSTLYCDITPDTVEVISTLSRPSWLRSDGDFQITHRTEEEYISVVESPRFSLETDSEISSLEIPVVDAGRAQKIELLVSDDAGENKYERAVYTGINEFPPSLWLETPVPNNADEVEIRIRTKSAGSLRSVESFFHNLFSDIDHSRIRQTEIGMPALIPEESQPPIFLISIDTLRQDCREELQPLIDELGDDAFVPSEPRTQGHWTPPSHASMLTGAHPGKHGYVGWGVGDGDERPINPDMSTIPELLTDAGYKCSALVSHSRILPEFGFGRGFHRFRYDGMSASDFITRNGDARDSVNQLTDWIERDLSARNHSLFYFLHVFDPHFPYTPPIELIESQDIDMRRSDDYREQVRKAEGPDWEWSYVDLYESKQDIDDELIEDLKSWYSRSVSYTGREIARLMRFLKIKNLFDESFVIITGDHGEEFEERGFVEHTSLYDTNIRPFMIIKPPKGENWGSRGNVSTIDFLPTIASLLDLEVPAHCDGVPIQQKSDDRPRITERIYPDWYNVAVEIENMKIIYTYESGYPDRPGRRIVREGPELVERYELSNVRSGDFVETELPTEIEEKAHKIHERFILRQDSQYTVDATARQPSQETKEQLEKLGYR